MEWSKVKTGLIILLVVVNVIFACLVGVRYLKLSSAEKDSFERVLVMSKERGFDFDEKALLALPASPKVLNYERDTEAEKTAAEYFLGSCSVTSPGGGVYVYESEKGSAGFRNGGYFEITVSIDHEPDVESELKKAGIDLSGAVLTANGISAGVNGFAAEGLSITWRCEGGKLFVSGRWYFSDAVKTESQSTRAGLLMEVMLAMEDRGITEMPEIYLVYTAVTGGEDLRLVPAWKAEWEDLKLTFPCA